eukprot:768602-Hanusia_phi.AAC.10
MGRPRSGDRPGSKVVGITAIPSGAAAAMASAALEARREVASWGSAREHEYRRRHSEAELATPTRIRRRGEESVFEEEEKHAKAAVYGSNYCVEQRQKWAGNVS